MEMTLIEIIAKHVKAQNKFFTSVGINGVQLPSGHVVRFSNYNDKQYIGISDCVGNAFYIKFNPLVNYAANERRFSSCRDEHNATVSCRLVAFSFDRTISAEKLRNKILQDLKNIPWPPESKAQLLIRKSNLSCADNFKEETKKEMPQEFVCISIDFDLKYFVNLSSCEPCNITEKC